MDEEQKKDVKRILGYVAIGMLVFSLMLLVIFYTSKNINLTMYYFAISLLALGEIFAYAAYGSIVLKITGYILGFTGIVIVINSLRSPTTNIDEVDEAIGYIYSSLSIVAGFGYIISGAILCLLGYNLFPHVFIGDLNEVLKKYNETNAQINNVQNVGNNPVNQKIENNYKNDNEYQKVNDHSIKVICKKCGNLVDEDAIYCNHCGNNITKDTKNDNVSINDFNEDKLDKTKTTKTKKTTNKDE